MTNIGGAPMGNSATKKIEEEIQIRVALIDCLKYDDFQQSVDRIMILLDQVKQELIREIRNGFIEIAIESGESCTRDELKGIMLYSRTLAYLSHLQSGEKREEEE